MGSKTKGKRLAKSQVKKSFSKPSPSKKAGPGKKVKGIFKPKVTVKKAMVKKTAKKIVKKQAAPLKQIAQKLVKAPMIKPKPEPKKNMKNLLNSNPVLRRYIIDIGGEQALAVLQALKYDKCTEDVIIRRSKSGKSDVRAALNKLHGLGLVEYIREKDENVGLYTYTWNMRYDKLSELSNKMLESSSAKSSEGASLEKFSCAACGSEEEYLFEEAMDIQFKCPFCGNLLAPNSETKE